jgi:hypothetical protein
MISAMRRSMAALAIRSLFMVSFRHKKTGARPVFKIGGAFGVDPNAPLLKRDIGGMGGDCKG